MDAVGAPGLGRVTVQGLRQFQALRRRAKRKSGQGSNRRSSAARGATGAIFALCQVMPTKSEVEMAVVADLLKALKITPEEFRRGCAGLNEPDVICRIGSSQVGIEVTGAFYSGQHARWQWLSAEENLPPSPPLTFGNPDTKLKAFVQERLNCKCGRRPYSGIDECWLCVAVRAELTGTPEMDDLVDSLRIPVGHSFNHIYLTHLEPMGGRGFVVRPLRKPRAMKSGHENGPDLADAERIAGRYHGWVLSVEEPLLPPVRFLDRRKRLAVRINLAEWLCGTAAAVWASVPPPPEKANPDAYASEVRAQAIEIRARRERQQAELRRELAESTPGLAPEFREAIGRLGERLSSPLSPEDIAEMTVRRENEQEWLTKIARWHPIFDAAVERHRHRLRVEWDEAASMLEESRLRKDGRVREHKRRLKAIRHEIAGLAHPAERVAGEPDLTLELVEAFREGFEIIDANGLGVVGLSRLRASQWDYLRVSPSGHFALLSFIHGPNYHTPIRRTGCGLLEFRKALPTSK